MPAILTDVKQMHGSLAPRTLGLGLLIAVAPLVASLESGCSSAPDSSSPSGVADGGATEDGGSNAGADGAGGQQDGAPAEGGPIVSSATASAVAVGRLHTCALTTTGGVRCWGQTERGQSGNGAPLGTSSAQLVPAQVVGLTSGITAIASGDDHSCALSAGGGVKCWGANGHGQLGNAPSTSNTNSTDSAVPVDVVGLGSGVKAIAAGPDHTCAIMTAGNVKCWGFNDAGQLGNGTNANSSVPVDVTGLTGVTAIAGGQGTYGSGHTCAVSAGKVHCWGSNTFGQLGQPETTNGSNVPLEIPSFTGAASVTGGFFTTCALMTSGGAKCWGKNDFGQLGNGVLDTFAPDVTVPDDVKTLTSGVTSLSAAQSYACAVAGGAAKCWGDNSDGVLGNGEDAGFRTAVPVPVSGLGSGVASISGHGGHVCALITGGALRCWGDNGSGGLGTTAVDQNSTARTPVPVMGFP